MINDIDTKSKKENIYSNKYNSTKYNSKQVQVLE